MDLVLEGFDTYIFDRIYSFVSPVPNAQYLISIAKGYAANAMQNASSGDAISWQRSDVAAKAFQEAGVAVSSTVRWPQTELFKTTIWSVLSKIPRDNVLRQAFSLFLIVWVFGLFLYFALASMSYHFIFDKETFNHPRYIKNQMRLEITQTMQAMPIMSALTVPWFLVELHGYGKLYTGSEKYGKQYLFWQVVLFIAFGDCLIYWIHRYLHHPLIYKYLHKPHHKWIMPTPFASHAFHPVDGYLQSLPYHIFPFIFPLHKYVYVFMFAFINIWTVLIHDGEYMAHDPVINGAACHSVHHLYFNYNYGQFTTMWDRIGNSYRRAEPEMFDSKRKNDPKLWRKQAAETDEFIRTVESDDHREYAKKVQ